jgi:hypothetical protein
MERGDEMNDLEQRLQEAADEIRRTTPAFTPPPLPSRRTNRGWLVAAAGFAVVIALGIGPLLGMNREPADGTSPTGEGSLPTGTTMLAGACSAAGMEMPAPQPGLPEAVAATRDQLAAAAIACDYPAMRALTADEFNTSFGGGGFNNLVKWEGTGEEPLRLLVQLLDTPFGVQEPEGMEAIYAWPAAFTYDTWEEVPQEQKDQLAEIYSPEEMDLLETYDLYALWRVGITESGQWRFFVAGD